MQITKRKKQAIKNIVAAILSLLLLFSALRLIPALLCALPDSGADYLDKRAQRARSGWTDGDTYFCPRRRQPPRRTARPCGTKAARKRRMTFRTRPTTQSCRSYPSTYAGMKRVKRPASICTTPPITTSTSTHLQTVHIP